MEKWTKKWPKRAGHYWFFGWPYGRDKTYNGQDILPELNHVYVRKVSNGLIHIRGGCFWAETEGWKGLFIKADIPELPNLKHLV